MGARIMNARIEGAQLARREEAWVQHGIATEDRVCDQNGLRSKTQAPAKERSG